MDYDKLIEDLRCWAAYCGQPCGCLTSRCILDNAVDAIETFRTNLARVMVERLRGKWIWHGEEVHCAAGNFPIKKCKQCKKEMLLDDYDNFCPACGAPMTDEAVNMMLKRWKETFDNDN